MNKNKNTYRKEYYEKNREKISIINKKRYEKNKDKIIKQHKEYCERNKEKIKQKAKENYYLSNREKEKIRDKIYKEKNKDKIKEYCKLYWRKNIERLKQYHKDYNEKNKDKKKQYAHTPKGKACFINSSHKRRMKCKITDITTDWLKDFREYSTHCKICGCEMNEIKFHSQSKHLDHIVPLSVGGMHTINNVRFICRKCNLSRPKDGSDIKQYQLNFINMA